MTFAEETEERDVLGGREGRQGADMSQLAKKARVREACREAGLPRGTRLDRAPGFWKAGPQQQRDVTEAVATTAAPPARWRYARKSSASSGAATVIT